MTVTRRSFLSRVLGAIAAPFVARKLPKAEPAPGSVVQGADGRFLGFATGEPDPDGRVQVVTSGYLQVDFGPRRCVFCGVPVPEERDGRPRLCVGCSVGRPSRWSGIPNGRWEPARCVFAFGFHPCGYRGPATSCDKTFDNCRRLGNQRRFGGVPLGRDVPTPGSRGPS